MKSQVKNLCRLFALLLVLPTMAFASEGGPKLDLAPKEKFSDRAALQHGAKLFINYCLNCHSASYVRYSNLKGIGLTDDQIKDNLLFTGEKVGDLMRIAMQRDDAQVWFGAPPPDLSVIARSRGSEAGSGADWLYSYLRGFYRDPSRPTGWNNTVFDKVGMPHILWELQGDQVLEAEPAAAGGEHGGAHAAHAAPKLKLVKQGTMTPAEYDNAVGDLVAFLVYIGEPTADTRKQLGVLVLVLLSILTLLSYLLKKEFWKDVH